MPNFPAPRPPASEASSSSSAFKADSSESLAGPSTSDQQRTQTSEVRKSTTPDVSIVVTSSPSKESTLSKTELLHKDQPSSSHATHPLSSVQQPQSRPVVQPTSLSEWQLLAVLQKANLVQYYETFISKGGDDINQIMQCEEEEFLEIMNLVGMASKPLHVRRLQRALTEFSNNQTAFNLAAMQAIGPPPTPSYTLPATADPIAFLLPGIAASLASLSSTSPAMVHSSIADTSTSSTFPTASLPTASPSLIQHPIGGSTVPLVATGFPALSLLGSLAPSLHTVTGAAAAANVLEGHDFSSDPLSARPSTSARLGSLTLPTHLPPSQKAEEGPSTSLLMSPVSEVLHQHILGPPVQYNDFVSLGDFDPNNCTQTAYLSPAQIARLTQCAHAIFSRLPTFQPRYVQNKKRVSKDIVDLMTMPVNEPNRAETFRKYSAIYGRFDAKRKASKVLSLHEVSVNEAAAQLCMLVPALLTRRDELFPLARRIVKDAGYHYAKGSRKRQGDSEVRSPSRSPSGSPPPGEASGEKRAKIADSSNAPSTSTGEK